jgi:hypothetical protein
MEIEVRGRAELIARAGSLARARALVREGAVRRVLRNAYVGSEHEDTIEVRVAAVRRSLPPDTAVTGRAALWMLGVDVLERSALVDVVVPRGRNLRPQAGLRQHSALVGEAEIHEHHGLLLVSPARVIIDAARLEAVHEAAVLGDASLRAGVTTPALLVQALERARGLRGVLGARLVLPLLNPRSESPMETRVRVELALAGVETEAQTDLYDVLEYDGLVAHTSRPAFTRDRRRHNAFSDAGLEVRRFSADDWYLRPRAVLIHDVRRALVVAQGKTSRGRCGPDTQRPPSLSPPVTLDRLRSAA